MTSIILFITRIVMILAVPASAVLLILKETGVLAIQGHDRNALLDYGTGHDVDMIMQFSRGFFDQAAFFFRTADGSFAVIQNRGHHGRRHTAESSYVF